jgi:uncharacterized protein
MQSSGATAGATPDYVSSMTDVERLETYLAGLGRVLLGYSGGVDSALLAVAGRRALGSDGFLAVIGRSDSYPEVQYHHALATARQFDVPLLEIRTRELEDPRYLANPTNRCYFCKSELWTRLREVAMERRFDAIVDGTNADDLGEHRPGLRAAQEQTIHSPLAELGWTKTRVRSAAQALGIPQWDAPASPCLSSRVRYGLAITSERLRQVEEGEAYLRSLGITGDLRVRHHGELAQVEVAPAQLPGLRAQWPAVESFFGAIGFRAVVLDPQGYRRGSLLGALPVLNA